MARGFSKTKNTTQKIIKGLLIAGAITIAGNSTHFVRNMLKEIKTHFLPSERQRYWEAVRRLRAKKIISVRDTKNGQIIVELTREGKKLALQFDLDSLKLKKGAWDKKWRVISYDIPNKFRRASMALSKKFHELGMYPYQRSIWVYPYDCRDEIDFVCGVFGLEPEKHVLYFETNKLPREIEIKNYFNL